APGVIARPGLRRRFALPVSAAHPLNFDIAVAMVLNASIRPMNEETSNPQPVTDNGRGSDAPPIRAVVFDLDGLMFNTEDIFNEVGRLVLFRRGKEMTRELLTQMMGRRAPEAIQLMIDFHCLQDTVAGLIDETRELFLELAVGRLAPMPGLYALM